ncbi:hypothetical protein GCM10009646_78730 [Streptomyces aureus]
MTDDCVHEDIIDRPGANPVCIGCGAINPDTTIPEVPTTDDEDFPATDSFPITD